MKYLVVLVLFFTYINSNAQLEYILTENEWYLYSLTIDGEEHMLPVNAEMPFVSLSFEDVNSEIIFNAQACNSGFGTVTIDEDNQSFSFLNGEISITLLLCDIQENNIFDGNYLGFYYNNIETPFVVYITWIDDPNSDEELLGIEVVSPNGDSAFYLNWLLSNEDFLASVFKIYPNPVTNSFYISSATNKNMAVLIYDITGKLILTKSYLESQDSINIENLKAGIYFVNISDEEGNTSIKKIIKD